MSKFSMKIATSVAIVGGLVAGAVSASAALNLPTMSCSYTFNTNLKSGSRGTDVMNLQKVLNMYPQTQIASSGAGSPGMETSTFGPATKRAVNKFQALHLVELGITTPTGNVFAGTRGLLNQVCSGTTSTNTGTGSTGTTGTGTVVSGPVSAMLASTQPTGMVVQKQSGARLADITFSGNGTVTSVQLQRTGVSADATLVNVYLYDGNTRITDAASVVTGGYINFNASNGLFTVSGTRTITVRADIADNTNGQSVGVKLNSVTAGGSVSTYNNVMGNALQIGSVATAGVNFTTVTVADTNVDAGTQAYNVWEGVASVNTRDVNLRAATFKFVGSAPVDSLANISLYVDGTKVAGPAMVNATNNNKLTFDLGSMPYLLKTGSHTIDVRGDVVKGSNRTMTFSVENVADLMFEDTNLAGVNVSATVNNATLTQGNSKYRTITVNKGSVTVNVDPSFVASKVTGGATNVPVAQFTLKGYGEDVKVNNLGVNFTLTNSSTTAPTGLATALGTVSNSLNNVSLYVNGGQVGTNQNYTGTALNYTLGSSLIIPAGQTVTVTVKADVVNTSSAAYNAGTITATLGNQGTGNAQGQNSNELTDVAATGVVGNSLTVSSGAGSFARTSGFTAISVAPNTSAVKIGSFSIQANSSEDIKVNSIGVNPVVATYGQTNISNLTLKSNGVVLGTPVGNPASGTSTFSFSDITIPANGTQSFDVYADIGGATSGSVTTAMSITYRGAVSNTTTTSSAAGVAITSAASTLALPTLVSSSPVSQFVVGGTTFGIATFKLATVQSGTSANVRELRFTTTGTDAIESITVGGVTSPVVSGGTTNITGLSLPISSTGTDVPVTVKYSGFQNSTTGGSLQSSVTPVSVTLSYVEGTSGSGSVISTTTAISSNNMTLVASKPTVTVSSVQGGTLILGAENKVGEFTVAADANGKVSVATATINTSAIGVTGADFSAFRVADGNTTISNSSVAETSSSTAVISFAPNYEISAGQSKTFSVYATVTGTAVSGITPYAASSLSASGFQWRDVIGGNTQFAGTNIINFPTNSYTTSR
jgi:hypothetical protein